MAYSPTLFRSGTLELYTIDPNMTITIPLTNRPDKQVIIDQGVYDTLAADPKLTELDFLNRLRQHNGGYAVFQNYMGKVDGKQQYDTIYLHKLIAERFIQKPRTDRSLFVRFIDSNTLNSTLENLEWVTMNTLRRHMKGASKTTGYRGVTVDRGRFRVTIYEGTVCYDLGFFDTADEGALAYNKKSRELFGETASLNVIPPED
jgi:hypothetical protein